MTEAVAAPATTPRRPARLALLLLAAAAVAIAAWLAGRDAAPALPTQPSAMPSAKTEPVDAPLADHAEALARARAEPAYLRQLIDRYAEQTDPQQRHALIALLQRVGNDEVMRFGMQLAKGSDPAERKDGLRLLQAFPLDRAPVRALLTEQLRSESDPVMQTQLLQMLTPTVMPVEDAAPLVAELTRLRDSADPDVRAASVLQTPQWDRQTDMEPLLHAVLSDPATQVRQAAIAGIAANRLRSPRLKDGLLGIALDPAVPPQERAAAVFALQEFALSRAEYALLREAAESDRSPPHEQD